MLIVGTFFAGVIFITLAARWHRLALRTARRSTSEPAFPVSPTTTIANDFHTPRPRIWLAIHHPDAAGVFATLGLNYPQPSHWNECEPGSGKMFVSVPVNGWTLVAGDGIPDPAEDVDRCYKFLANLSTALGHVQLFALNPVLNRHAWARLESGRVIRAYVWAGGTLWNQGGFTAEERQLGMKCLAYSDEVDPFDWQLREELSENLPKIPALAAQWSVDPAELDAIPSAQLAGAAGFSGWIAS